MKNQHDGFQLLWGALLLLAGIGVFYRSPAVIAQVKTIPVFSEGAIYFVCFCFYLLGILLIWGGARKILTRLNMRKQV